MLEERGERYGSGAFGEGLFAFEQHEDGFGDFLFVYGDEFVDIVLDEGEELLSGAVYGDAVGELPGGSGGW